MYIKKTPEKSTEKENTSILKISLKIQKKISTYQEGIRLKVRCKQFFEWQTFFCSSSFYVQNLTCIKYNIWSCYPVFWKAQRTSKWQNKTCFQLIDTLFSALWYTTERIKKRQVINQELGEGKECMVFVVVKLRNLFRLRKINSMGRTHEISPARYF